MSSRTPQECVDLAVDSSASREDREAAVDELKTANECDELAEIAANEDLSSDIRQRALRAIATPQCDSMLRNLVERGGLDESLQQQAEELLDELDA